MTLTGGCSSPSCGSSRVSCSSCVSTNTDTWTPRQSRVPSRVRFPRPVMRTGPQWQSTRKVESGRGPLRVRSGLDRTRTANTARRAAAHRESETRPQCTAVGTVHAVFIFIIISFRSSTYNCVHTTRTLKRCAVRGRFLLAQDATETYATVNANHDANTQRNGATHPQRGVTNSRPNTGSCAHGATKHSTVPILYRPCGALPWRQPTGPAQESL